MALDFEGCSDNEALRNWFLFILETPSIQEDLIACKTQEEFADSVMDLSRKHGFSFPREALDETLSGSGVDHFPDLEKTDRWTHKLLQVGWSPLGYSR